MLDSIKRWFGAPAVNVPDWSELSSWARQRQWALRAVRDPDGFVVDGRAGDTPWRLEWGPSQRSYVVGAELRLRAELDVPRELQAMVLRRSLMDTMEKSMFEQYVEGVQTRIDTATPPEMRWLVMHQKLTGAELKSLRDGWGALSSYKPWLLQWLAGSLGPALAALSASDDRALLLMIARRRLSLRMALSEPRPVALEGWVQLFECALQQARRVVVDTADAQGPSTQPSLFAASMQPADAAPS